MSRRHKHHRQRRPEPCRLVELAPGRFVVRGELCRQQVPAVWRQRQQLWDSAPEELELVLSLSDVTRGDSAGLALLLALQAEADAQQRTLRLCEIPASLLAAARLSRLDRILCWSSTVQA